MKIGVCISLTEEQVISREKLVEGPKMVERLGFDGLWFFDTIGRARALPDPLIGVSVVASVTERITLGTCIYQVPLRNSVELAHRMMTVNLLAGDRLLWRASAPVRRRTTFPRLAKTMRGVSRNCAPHCRLCDSFGPGTPLTGRICSRGPKSAKAQKFSLASWAGSIWIRAREGVRWLDRVRSLHKYRHHEGRPQALPRQGWRHRGGCEYPC